MRRTRKSFLTFVMTIAAGACFQLGGCNVLGMARSAIDSINPCGTILACDPRAYQFLRSGIDGPGVRPNIDPFCTFAPFCDNGTDPIFGGLAAGGTTP